MSVTKYQASWITWQDRLERWSAVLLRLALGATFIAAAIACIQFRRAGGEVVLPLSLHLPTTIVWASITLELLTGGVLIVGYHIRAVTLACGLLLLLRALATMVVSLSLAGLIFSAAAAAFILAARSSHPWSLDYFFSGDWLPIAE